MKQVTPLDDIEYGDRITLDSARPRDDSPPRCVTDQGTFLGLVRNPLGCWYLRFHNGYCEIALPAKWVTRIEKHGDRD